MLVHIFTDRVLPAAIMFCSKNIFLIMHFGSKLSSNTVVELYFSVLRNTIFLSSEKHLYSPHQSLSPLSSISSKSNPKNISFIIVQSLTFKNGIKLDKPFHERSH